MLSRGGYYYPGGMLPGGGICACAMCEYVHVYACVCPQILNRHKPAVPKITQRPVNPYATQTHRSHRTQARQPVPTTTHRPHRTPARQHPVPTTAILQRLAQNVTIRASRPRMVTWTRLLRYVLFVFVFIFDISVFVLIFVIFLVC